MKELLEALIDPSVPFLRMAFTAGIAASFALGIMGTYVVCRRISYLAGAIAHSILGGIGIAIYLQQVHGITWATPMLGGLASAIASAIVIGLVSMYAKEREDTITGAIWASGMALGLLFIAKTPGYVDAMGYLFGNILLTAKSDIMTAAVLNMAILSLVLLFYRKFQAVCFDEQFARIKGIRTGVYYILLLCMTAVTVVMLVRIVGIILVIALLTLPAAIAQKFTSRMWHMMLLSTVISGLFCTTGLTCGYITNLPPGPCIIMIAGLTYLVTAVTGKK